MGQRVTAIDRMFQGLQNLMRRPPKEADFDRVSGGQDRAPVQRVTPEAKTGENRTAVIDETLQQRADLSRNARNLQSFSHEMVDDFMARIDRTEGEAIRETIDNIEFNRPHVRELLLITHEEGGRGEEGGHGVSPTEMERTLNEIRSETPLANEDEVRTERANERERLAREKESLEEQARPRPEEGLPINNPVLNKSLFERVSGFEPGQRPRR